MNVMRKTGLKIRKTNTKSCFGTYMALYDDAAFHNDSLRLIEPYQKINQFPDAEVIWYNKGRMWNDLKTQMVRFGKEEFDFVPDTFLWPEEKMDLKEQFSTSAFWITKPVQVSSWNFVPYLDYLVISCLSQTSCSFTEWSYQWYFVCFFINMEKNLLSKNFKRNCKWADSESGSQNYI